MENNVRRGLLHVKPWFKEEAYKEQFENELQFLQSIIDEWIKNSDYPLPLDDADDAGASAGADYARAFAEGYAEEMAKGELQHTNAIYPDEIPRTLLASSLGGAMSDIGFSQSLVEEVGQYAQMLADASDRARELKSNLDMKTQHRDLIKGNMDFVNSLGTGVKMTDEQQKRFNQLKAAYNATNLGELRSKLADAFAGAEQGADSAQEALDLMVADFQTQFAGLQAIADEQIEMQGFVDIETESAMAALQALIAYATENGLEIEGGGKERKGGGGSKKSKKERAAEEARKAAEEAQRAQEAAWQRELDEQLKHLDRKKRLGEINTQEEIRQLEYIAAHYARTTQQKISMEEKLFEAALKIFTSYSVYTVLIVLDEIVFARYNGFEHKRTKIIQIEDRG